jgi:hypothetical protein
MLEDGEIDGEDEGVLHDESEETSAEPTARSKSHRTKRSKKHEKREKHYHDTDDRVDQADSDENSGNGMSKRKSKSGASSSGKRNRKNQHTMDLLEEDLADSGNNEENSLGGDIDERFVPAAAPAPPQLTSLPSMSQFSNAATSLLPSMFNNNSINPASTLNHDQVNIVSSVMNPMYSQQATASLLDLFKNTASLFAQAAVASSSTAVEPTMFEKENNKPFKKKTLLGKPNQPGSFMNDSAFRGGAVDQDRKRKALLQTPDEDEMTVNVADIEKKVNILTLMPY